ncbi:MAG TPA: tetratricopeptide repeat protein, partial [Flavisolibacter sp.]|nr:tetratricopeptide repeat protein [Flavisolibacter sp.]
MKTICLGLLGSLFLCTGLEAQNIQPVNSGEIISNGLSLHDKGKYKEAINLYRQVPRNDTNYAKALYEMALSLTTDSNFTEALNTCEKGMQLDNSPYESSFRILYGSILDDQGDQKRALQVYDSALIKYPQLQGLLQNRAITLMRMKKYDEAESILKGLIIKNPFFSNAHYRLGICELNKGQIVPAVMCLFTYLLNNPGGTYSNHAINLLDNISKSTDEIMEFINKRPEQPAGNFAVVEQIILSKIALDKNYKVI